MDNWDDLRFVLAMSRHGTMSAAARHLSTNVATVSRRLDRLSQDLGLPLFEKRGQGWVGTPTARRLADLAESVDQELRGRSLAQAASGGGAPCPIEIAAPPAVHAALLVPRVGALLARFPQLRPSFADKMLSQGLGEADIQIRVDRPEGGRLKARRLMSYVSHVHHGADHRLDGRWIGLGPRYAEADKLPLLYPGADPLPMVRVGSMGALAGLAAETGLPAYLPDFLARRHPGLRVADLPDNARARELWIAYHETRHGDETLRAVVDWIVAAAAELQVG
jgi:DNA-binding transcriptional LysR family regulator